MNNLIILCTHQLSTVIAGFEAGGGGPKFPSENSDFAQIAIRKGIQSDWCPLQPGGRDPGVPLKCITLDIGKEIPPSSFFSNRDSYHRVLLCIRGFHKSPWSKFPESNSST